MVNILTGESDPKERCRASISGKARLERTDPLNPCSRCPALHQALEFGEFARPVAPEPLRLDHAAAQWRRRLLVLAGKVVLAEAANPVPVSLKIGDDAGSTVVTAVEVR